MAKQKVLLALFLLFAITLFSQSKQEFDSEAITKILYQHSSDASPGIAVGIVKDGNIAYEYYLGYANLEHEIEIDKDTRFNIASNAKQFTALCILKLIEQEKINLEDDFRKYLPDLYKNVQDKITVSNLLTHTSGIRDVYDLWALKGKSWWKLFIDNGDAIELLQFQKDLNFKPGTEYLYSNSNYILLAEIVKKVTDRDFSEFAKTMFEELEMPGTNFLTNYMTVVPNKARPYGNWNGWREYPSITEIHGDGALFTTLKDQLKWEQIIQRNNGKYFSKRLINESQSQIENSIASGYGYGLMFDNYMGLKYTCHDGSTGAYHATFLRFPTKKTAIVVMSNSGSVPANYLAWQIADLVLDLENDNTVYPGNPDKIEKLKSIQDVLGNYKNDDGTIVRITEKDGSIYREIYQREPVKLISERGGLFQYETIRDLKMNFTNIGKPEQKFTLYLSSQKPGTYYKLSNLNLNNFDKNELNGSFYNDETDTKIVIKFIDNTTYSITKNGRERKAELILEDYLRMNSYKIKIIRDKEDHVIGLNVKNGRIKNVIFNRI